MVWHRLSSVAIKLFCADVLLQVEEAYLFMFLTRGVSVIIVRTGKQVLRTRHSHFTRLSVRIKVLSVRTIITETPLI